MAADPQANYGKKFYHFIDENKVPFKVKTRPIEKFPKKYLIWTAMDEFGNVSEPYIKEGTMNSAEYIEECIVKRLIPFLRAHHNVNETLFWPDMAPIHYSKTVLECLKSNGIEFVSKQGNASAVPQARPIERFWAHCKYHYSLRTETPKTLRIFKTVWSEISQFVAQNNAKALTRTMRRSLRLIGDKGVEASFD